MKISVWLLVPIVAFVGLLEFFVLQGSRRPPVIAGQNFTVQPGGQSRRLAGIKVYLIDAKTFDAEMKSALSAHSEALRHHSEMLDKLYTSHSRMTDLLANARTGEEMERFTNAVKFDRGLIEQERAWREQEISSVFEEATAGCPFLSETLTNPSGEFNLEGIQSQGPARYVVAMCSVSAGSEQKFLRWRIPAHGRPQK